MVKRDLLLFVGGFFVRWGIWSALLYFTFTEGCGWKGGGPDGGDPLRLSAILGFLITLLRTIKRLRELGRASRY